MLHLQLKVGKGEYKLKSLESRFIIQKRTDSLGKFYPINTIYYILLKALLKQVK